MNKGRQKEQQIELKSIKTTDRKTTQEAVKIGSPSLKAKSIG